MDQATVLAALEEPTSMLRADGADLDLVDVDAGAARVTVRLEVADASCQDCILPPAQLREALTASLQRQLRTEIEVIVEDPRAGGGGSAGGSEVRTADVWPAAPPADRSDDAPLIRIRVPVAEQREIVGAPSFTVDGPLKGLRIGLRHEGSWRSWMLIVEDWEAMLRQDGAEPVVLQTGERVGTQGTSTAANVAAWTDAVDCGISGLGTCGSCTSWSVHDAAALEAAGKPAVVAVCTEFVTHACNMATHLGHPELKVLELPYPLEGRPPEELHRVAHDFYPAFLEILGVKA